MTDDDKLLDIAGLEFGSGVIGVCDICGRRQAVIVLQKERFKLCVIDFLNKTWTSSKSVAGAPLPAYRSDRIWYPTDASPIGKAPAIVLSPTRAVKRPTVLITPDVYGITTMLAEAAIRFAKEGFEVMIPDLTKTVGVGPGHHLSLRFGSHLGKGVAIGSPKVTHLTHLYADALRHLRSREMVDTTKSALFGAAYGGSLAIALACQDAKVSAVALAYPMAVTPPDSVRAIGVPVLFVSGGRDRAAARSRVPFDLASQGGQLTVAFADFPEAGHQFLSRDVQTYRMSDAEAAWTQIAAFLKTHLMPPPPKPAVPPRPAPAASPPPSPSANPTDPTPGASPIPAPVPAAARAPASPTPSPS